MLEIIRASGYFLKKRKIPHNPPQNKGGTETVQLLLKTARGENIFPRSSSDDLFDVLEEELET